jgi:hypothetical protein
VTDDDEPSPGRLFIDAFLDKNLVGFDECRTYYEGMTPDELVDELGFLFSKPAMAIRFDFSGNRYYAFLVSLVQCAASCRDLRDNQRSKLINMAIDVRDYVRDRTAEDKRKTLDNALSATLDYIRLYELYPVVSDLVAGGVRDYAGNFPTSPVGEILNKPKGAFAVPNDQVPGLLFNDGPGSAEAIRVYLHANGDPLPLEDYGAYLLRQSGAVRDDGTLDLQKLTAWEIRYSGALSMLPGLQSKLDVGKLDVARQAQEALEKAVANKEADLDRFRRSPAMLFVNHDPMTATRELFALPDTTTAMRTLVKMMEGNRAAIDGLRQAVADYIRDQVGVTDDMAEEYREFLRMHDRALSVLFDNDKMQILRNIAFSLERSHLLKDTSKEILKPVEKVLKSDEQFHVAHGDGQKTTNGIMKFLRSSAQLIEISLRHKISRIGKPRTDPQLVKIAEEERIEVEIALKTKFAPNMSNFLSAGFQNADNFLTIIQSGDRYERTNDLFLFGILLEIVEHRPKLPTEPFMRVQLHLLSYFMKEVELTLDDARVRVGRIEAWYNDANESFDRIIDMGRRAHRTSELDLLCKCQFG